MAKDEQRFQPQVTHNAFMEDVVTDDSYLTGPTGSFQVASLGAVEDLLQAMGQCPSILNLSSVKYTPTTAMNSSTVPGPL